MITGKDLRAYKKRAMDEGSGLTGITGTELEDLVDLAQKYYDLQADVIIAAELLSGLAEPLNQALGILRREVAQS